MRVQDILRLKNDARIISASPEELVSTAVHRLDENGVGVLVVLDDDSRVVGIFSERDVVRGLARHGPSVLNQRIEALMSRPIHTCRPADAVADVMARMTNHRIRHLPVVEDDRLQGIVSIGDVVKHRLAEMQTEAAVLRDIIVAR